MALPSTYEFTNPTKVLEDSMLAWFREVTGLTCLWANQDAPEMNFPFGLLEPITGFSRVGGGFDRKRWETTLTDPAGEEVKISNENQYEITISCKAFVGPPNNNDPLNNARALLSKALSSVESGIINDTYFIPNGLSLIRGGEVSALDEVVNNDWISVANIDVSVMAIMSSSFKTGYIKTTKIKGTTNGQVDFDQLFGDI